MSEEGPSRIRLLDLEEAEADAADFEVLVQRWHHLAEEVLTVAGGAPLFSVLAQLRDEFRAALVWVGSDPRRLSEEGLSASLEDAEMLIEEMAIHGTRPETPGTKGDDAAEEGSR